MVRIIVDPAQGLRGNSSGDVAIGVIYFESDGAFFPAHNWTDFAFPILGWWITACENIMDGAAVELFAFMDGPVEFRVEPISDVEVKLTSIVERRESTARAFGSVAFVDLLGEIVAACRAIDVACAQHGLALDVDYAPRAEQLRHRFTVNGGRLRAPQH